MIKRKCKCSPNCDFCACGWMICECEEILKCRHEFYKYICCCEGKVFCDKCDVKLWVWIMNFDGEEPSTIPTKKKCKDCERSMIYKKLR